MYIKLIHYSYDDSAILKSYDGCFTICNKIGASSYKAVSSASSYQLLISIPLEGCLEKFDATLSTITDCANGLPSRERSFI